MQMICVDSVAAIPIAPSNVAVGDDLYVVRRGERLMAMKSRNYGGEAKFVKTTLLPKGVTGGEGKETGVPTEILGKSTAFLGMIPVGGIMMVQIPRIQIPQSGSTWTPSEICFKKRRILD